MDYEQGGLLHLSARAELLWPGEPGVDLSPWPGAQRLLRLRVAAGLWRAGASPWRWSAPEPAPQFAALRAAGATAGV